MIKLNLIGGKMKTIEELKREQARLKSEMEVREDFAKRDRERIELIRQNRKLRHYKIASAVQSTKKGASFLGKNISGATRGVVKSVRKGKLKKIGKRINKNPFGNVRMPTYKF